MAGIASGSAGSLQMIWRYPCSSSRCDPHPASRALPADRFRHQPAGRNRASFRDELRGKTAAFQRLTLGLDNQRPILNEILLEAFAVVREAGKRARQGHRRAADRRHGAS